MTETTAENGDRPHKGTAVVCSADHGNCSFPEFYCSMPVGSPILFLFGAILLVLGVGLFSLGVDLAMLPIGDGIGGQIAGSRKLWWMIPVCFMIGVFVTIAEPDADSLLRGRLRDGVSCPERVSCRDI